MRDICRVIRRAHTQRSRLLVAAFDSTFSGTLLVRVSASDGASLELEPIDFIWNTHTPINQTAGDYRNGQARPVAAIIYVYMYMYTYMCILMYMYMYVCMCICICICICIYVYDAYL